MFDTARGRWGLGCGLVACMTVTVVLVVPVGPAGARRSPLAPSAVRYGIDIQAVFGLAGNPLLVANFSPDGSLATPGWSACRPSLPCRTIRSHSGVLQSGSQPVGTRFIATASFRGHAYRATVTWRGSVHAISRPRLLGNRKLGGVLRPVAGRWRGGWGGESDQTGVEACLTKTAKRCRMLGGGELGCPDNSSRTHLGGWFTGWYVFALDARSARDDICTGTGYFANADLPLWKLGPAVVRSRALGRIAGPPRPTVKILPQATLSGGRLLVASLNCATQCLVTLEVGDSTVGLPARLTVTGRRMIGVRPGPLAHGPLTVDMHIDDSALIHGTSRF